VDLFASAIVLFTILCQRPPFRVAKPNDPHYSLLAKGENDIFWEAHAEANGGDDIFSSEFKDMFQQIMKLDPKKATYHRVDQPARLDAGQYAISRRDFPGLHPSQAGG